MSILAANQSQLIAFVILDTSGDPLAGLGTAFVLQVSKNGGAFAGSTGTKAEIGSGWYSYELTAAETDTNGPLAIKATHAGAEQTNLLYDIRPYNAEEPAGANILTSSEAAAVLRCATDDALMLDLLPAIDGYVEQATGRDWAADSTIEPLAKAAARMLLVMWHENPAMISSGMNSLGFGLAAVLTQLEAKALTLETSGIPDAALEIIASQPEDGATEVAISSSLVLVFNNAMAAAATSAVTLQTLAGVSVACTNSLDVTSKILTINPDSDLSAATNYQIVLTAAADQYGQTITDTLSFATA